MRLYEGQQAVVSTGGSHFWPYGLNFDSEDGVSARERHVKMVAALRFDIGIVVDSDGDMLPDDWETHHFGSLAQTGTGDPDGDGLVNLDEHRTDADPNQACPVRDGHAYRIRSQRSGLLLTAIVPTAGDAFTLTEQRSDGAAPEAQWIARLVGEGWFRFENVESGWVLEVPSTSVASGLPVRQAPWMTVLRQQWRVVGGPGAQTGYTQLANRETARVVDGLVGTTEGTGVQQYPFWGDTSQQFWQFEEVPTQGEPDAGPMTDGGMPPIDASMPGMDGGMLDDGGTAPDGGGGLRGSCSVGHSRRSSSWWITIVALGLMSTLRRRRV
jgi:hypothetical protein